MILKKPYAFLIKKFRIIHLILTILIGFVLYKSVLINNFFIQYINNSYSTSYLVGSSSEYISNILFISIFCILFLAFAIYYLLKHKNKPSKMYLFIIIYYLFLFIYLIYLKGVINGLTEELLNAKASRTLRDITIIISLFQILFLLLSLIRTTGFDIKKFDFKSDLKELDMGFSDSEEVEVNFKFNSYKYKRKIRRNLREFIYYIKENKLFVMIFLGIISLVLIITLVSKKVGNLDINTSMKKMFIYDNMNITIENAIITNVDYNGNEIDSGKYYVVLNTHLINNTGYTKKVDFNRFSLKVGKNIIKPKQNLSNKFIDFSPVNIAKDFAPKTDKYFSLVYEISEKEKNNSMELQIYNGSSYVKGKEITKYIYVKVSGKKKENVKLNKSYLLGEKIIFNDTFLNNTTFRVDNYEINKSYFYTYEKCVNDDCNVYDDVITPNKINNYLITFFTKSKIDNDTLYGKSYSKLSDFANNFVSILYKTGDKTYESKKSLTPSSSDNFIVFEVNDNIINADLIQVVIVIRDQKYLVTLKS